MINQYRSIDPSLIPDPSIDIPNMNQIAVIKNSIEDIESFRRLIDLFNLIIISDEVNYYILDGSDQDILDFKLFWNDFD